MAAEIREGRCSDSPCRDIVNFQKNPHLPFHFPEPWSGDLTRASLLFIGSNPSIDYNEAYPNERWDGGDKKIVAFFEQRFAAQQPHINSEWRTLQVFGVNQYGNVVPYLRAVHELAKEILRSPPKPGVDYALTEIVHCKSWGQTGVPEAIALCAERYLDKVLAASGARVLIVLGAHARDAICERYTLPNPKDSRIPNSQLLTIKKRKFEAIFLPHPSAFLRKDKKCIKSVIGPEEFDRISTLLNAI